VFSNSLIRSVSASEPAGECFSGERRSEALSLFLSPEFTQNRLSVVTTEKLFFKTMLFDLRDRVPLFFPGFTNAYPVCPTQKIILFSN